MKQGVNLPLFRAGPKYRVRHAPSLTLQASDIHFPELTPRSPSEIVVKNINQKLMRLSTCKASSNGNKASPRNRNLRSPDTFRFPVPNEEAATKTQEFKTPITPCKLSIIFQGAEGKLGATRPNRSVDTPALRQTARENAKLSSRMKDSVLDLFALPNPLQTDRLGGVGSINMEMSRPKNILKEAFISVRNNSPEKLHPRSALMTPSKKSGQTFRHLLSTYQKQYIENVAVTTPSVFMATELMNTDAPPNQARPFKYPWSVIEEQQHASQNNIPSTPTNKDSNKERLKKRLKKSSFPAVMAKQRARKERIVSLSVRNNEDMEIFDEEDHRKIFDMKKEKEYKRLKAIKALDNYNLNLFKPTTLKIPPALNQNYLSL